MKINRRLINIAILSFVVALVFTFAAYKTIKHSVTPESREKIVYFKNNIKKGSIITASDLYMKDTPVSFIPENAVRNIESCVDKTLVIDATPNDFALTTNFIGRGETLIDVDNMYQIGIAVEKIDNFLGTQLKNGEFYGLLYINNEGNSGKVYKVKLINMIDRTGKVVVESGEDVIEEINVAVEDHNDVREIAESKRTGTFELIKVPKDKWDIINQPMNEQIKEDKEDIEKTSKS